MTDRSRNYSSPLRESAGRGRPREFDKETALAEIMDVFWSKGFEGTALSDLVGATGLKKGSLYAAFGDKRAIYLKALALYDRTAIDGAVALLTSTGTPKQRIDAFLQSTIDVVAASNDRRGCFLCNASIDQAMLDSETGRAVKAGLERLGNALEEALSTDAVDGSRACAEAQLVLSVYFGLRVLAKGGASAQTLRDAKQALLRNIAMLKD